MSDTNFDGLKLESRSIMDFFYPVFIFCAVYIALFCWLRFYAWLQIDDWAFFNWTAKYNNIFSYVITRAFSESTGRVGYHFLMYPFASLKFENVYWFFPTFTIITYTFAVYFCAATIAQKSSLKTKILITLIITAVTISTLTTLNEILYWLAVFLEHIAFRACLH